MEIARFSAGLPVLLFECEASITMRGEPTVFERMVLNLCARFERNSDYNQIPVFALIRDFLGVSNPDYILTATINDLVGIDLLRCRQDLQAIREISLADLEITDRGRQVLAHGGLPSVAQVHVQTAHYDPFRSRLLRERDVNDLSQDAPPIHLDSTVFEDIWPEEIIRELFGKLQEQRTIARLAVGDVRRRGIQVLWRNSQAAVHIDQGRFKIELRDRAAESYVSSIPDESVVSQILRPALVGPGIDQKAMSHWLEAEPDDPNAEFWKPLRWLSNDLMPSARVLMLDGESDSSPGPQESRCGQLKVCYRLSDKAPLVETSWSDDGSGCLLRVNSPYPFTSTVLATQDFVARGRMVRIRGVSGDYRFPLAFCDETVETKAQIASELSKIAALLHEHRPEEEARVGAFWNR